MSRKSKPYVVFMVGGNYYKASIREWKIDKSILLVKEIKKKRKEIKKKRKELSEYIRELTEPERLFLTKKLKMTENQLWYDYVEY